MLTASESAPLFKALSDEARLRILDMLSCGELCACELLERFAFTQPTLSYHMRILTKAGLVRARKDGSWTRYTLEAERFASLRAFLDHAASDKEDCPCKES
jgi:ArsR family transcriptional regulator